ncbi:hypothetical protein IVB45_20785 [Bradyrhizobium sp. 4]|uniref:hypothetical protein n=1 Tax=unclassified Bradyrhizobium TaxID=2631580 RepID=UPI001FF9E21A|nr:MULTISPECIES: hypothetical protein [unclassified Bradyrhizobium]MCK1322934.1 hypothetical protein [Bradyrhizobium sp. 156]MCK1402338.1 hypothetical protein [Bradyrhizobium sp. 39]MCK1563623.1 hypothetical protein [Bradyrhizobium sp. 173]MCK1747933.1 hypothetical protein [Bradyrhizobium sp. 135]UPJ32426.1 hypothetical protein IVB45_20785 [Bradyrhizobium sp. 4]
MAKKTDMDFTKRTVIAMAQEMVNAKSAVDRSFAAFKALAKEHGVKMPKAD